MKPIAFVRHFWANYGRVLLTWLNVLFVPFVYLGQLAYKRYRPPCTLVHLEMCTICQTDIFLDEPISFPSCGHMFHEICIGEWMKHQLVCPLCRTCFKISDIGFGKNLCLAPLNVKDKKDNKICFNPKRKAAINAKPKGRQPLRSYLVQRKEIEAKRSVCSKMLSYTVGLLGRLKDL